MSDTLGNRVVRAIAKKAHPEFGDDCYFCNVAMAPLAEAVDAFAGTAHYLFRESPPCWCLPKQDGHDARCEANRATLSKLKEIADGK